MPGAASACGRSTAGACGRTAAAGVPAAAVRAVGATPAASPSRDASAGRPARSGTALAAVPTTIVRCGVTSGCGNTGAPANAAALTCAVDCATGLPAAKLACDTATVASGRFAYPCAGAVAYTPASVVWLYRLRTSATFGSWMLAAFTRFTYRALE